MLSLLQIRLIAYAVLALTILGAVGYVKYEWDSGRAAKHKLDVVQAQQRAVVAAVVSTDRVAAQHETQAQATIQTVTRTIVKRIPTYVHVSTPGAPVPCIPWGFVRLHDAAVLGVDPASLPNPAGQSDDACSTITYPDLAARIADNYAAARANAEQLNALEADARARSASAASAGAASGR